MKRNSWLLLILPLLMITVSCNDDRPVPKPRALLRLDFPEPAYEAFENMKGCGFAFLKNSLAAVRTEENCSMEISYRGMKGTIFLTYKPVEGNLQSLLRDAQKLSYEHMSKADRITEQPYVNPETGVYGMYYEVSGNAASQSQFYVTDSSSHFLAGALYFESVPNYDSILPAAQYLRDDIRVLMESIQWNP